MQLDPGIKGWFERGDPQRPDPYGEEAAARQALVARIDAVLEEQHMLPWPDWTTAEWEAKLAAVEPKALGGPGSGNFGHAGRPGEVGGSAPDHEGPEDANDIRHIMPNASDLERFHQLKAEWAIANNEMLKYLDKQDSPEAQALMGRMKDIVKQIYTLDVDPGGQEGIGLPGGPRDVLIIGSGPGGLSAGIMASYDGLDTLIVDANVEPGGQSKHSSRIENFPGFPAGVSGAELATKSFSQAERLGAETRLGTKVTGLTYDDKTGLKTVTFDDGRTETARTVVIAGGVEFKKLMDKENNPMEGANAKGVIYDADSETLANEGEGKTVVVLGGSNGAAQAALGAASKANDVYIVSRSPLQKGMSHAQSLSVENHPRIGNDRIVIGNEVDKVLTNDQGHVTGVHLTNGKTLKADTVGVFIGSVPNTSWLPSSIRLKENKIDVNINLETTMPGVFAVGDVRNGSYGRIGIAVGDGQLASRNAFEYFKKMPKKGKS